MIRIKLLGRLGNQLFIYAFARQLLEENQNINEIQLLTYEDTTILGEVVRQELTDFNIDTRIKVIDIKKSECYPDGKLRKMCFKATRRIFYTLFPKKSGYVIENISYKLILKNMRVFLCNDGYKNPDWLYKTNNKKDVFCCGFFQSEKYFMNIRETLLREIQPKNSLSMQANILQVLIENAENSVCISIRCGDFLKLDGYNVCTPEYFKGGVNYVCKKIKNPTFFLFSDDVDMAKQFISFGENEVFVEPKGLKTYEKLAVMSKCKHFIISNSTFSWWTQYLGTNPEKIVIAPDKWWGNNCKVPCDIYQENWIKISTLNGECVKC